MLACKQLINNNKDELYSIKKERRNEIPDSLRTDFRKPIIIKINKDINDEIRPRDSKRKKQNNNNINEKNKTKVTLNKREINNCFSNSVLANL